MSFNSKLKRKVKSGVLFHTSGRIISVRGEKCLAPGLQGSTLKGGSYCYLFQEGTQEWCNFCRDHANPWGAGMQWGGGRKVGDVVDTKMGKDSRLQCS